MRSKRKGLSACSLFSIESSNQRNGRRKGYNEISKLKQSFYDSGKIIGECSIGFRASNIFEEFSLASLQTKSY